jgi:hypothetical protein
VRRILVLAAAAALVLVSVPFATAGTTAPPRHVEGSFATVGNPNSASFLFEVRASSNSRVEFGYYQFEMTTAQTGELPNRSQATVESVRFFKAASGAPAAEFSGHECALAAPNAADIGKCPWYHIIVTDGASIHEPDTFCGGPSKDVCYEWFPTYGDIRIY